MEESILKSIKALLGLTEEQSEYDFEIMMHINSCFTTLSQLGYKPFRITSVDEPWADFTEDAINYEQVKSYIYTCVRLLFDPPQMGYLVENMKDFKSEFEFRLNVQAENVEKGV